MSARSYENRSKKGARTRAADTMRIIILGAGRVGESVAETLASEATDITVVDPNPERLHALEDRVELRGVAGNGIQPSVLRGAVFGRQAALHACGETA